MNVRPDDAGGPGEGRDADIDPGEPLAELRALAEEPSPRLVPNVIGGIHRRQAVTQAVELTWWGLTGMLMEFLQALLRTLGVREDKDTEG